MQTPGTSRFPAPARRHALPVALVAGLACAVLSVAASAQPLPAPPPPPGDEPALLAGPRVQQRKAPGLPDSFADSQRSRQRASMLMVPMRVVEQAVAELAREDADPALALDPEQRQQVRRITQEHRQRVRSFVAENRDELRRLRDDAVRAGIDIGPIERELDRMGAELGREQQQQRPSERGRDNPGAPRPDGPGPEQRRDRGGGRGGPGMPPDQAPGPRPRPERDRMPGDMPRDMMGDMPPRGEPPAPEAERRNRQRTSSDAAGDRGDLRDRFAELRGRAPRSDELQQQVWEILTPAQREHVEQRIERFRQERERERTQAQERQYRERIAKEFEDRRGPGPAGPGSQGAGPALDRLPPQMRERLESMSPEDRARALQRLRERWEAGQAGPPDQRPPSTGEDRPRRRQGQGRPPL